MSRTIINENGKFMVRDLDTDLTVSKKTLFGELLMIPEVAGNEVYTAFLNHEIELINNKVQKSKQYKRAVDENKVKEDTANMELIMSVFTDKSVIATVTEVRDGYLPHLSVQKVSNLMNRLVKAERLLKKSEKRTTYFYRIVFDEE